MESLRSGLNKSRGPKGGESLILWNVFWVQTNDAGLEKRKAAQLCNCGFQDRTNTRFIANSVWLFHCIPLWRGRKWASHYPRSREAQQVRPVAVHLEIWLEPPHITDIVPMLEACTYAYDTLQMGIKANTSLLLLFFKYKRLPVLSALPPPPLPPSSF